MSFFTIYRV